VLAGAGLAFGVALVEGELEGDDVAAPVEPAGGDVVLPAEVEPLRDGVPLAAEIDPDAVGDVELPETVEDGDPPLVEP
jgi:hypothetical protein